MSKPIPEGGIPPVSPEERLRAFAERYRGSVDAAARERFRARCEDLGLRFDRRRAHGPRRARHAGQGPGVPERGALLQRRSRLGRPGRDGDAAAARPPDGHGPLLRGGDVRLRGEPSPRPRTAPGHARGQPGRRPQPRRLPRRGDRSLRRERPIDGIRGSSAGRPSTRRSGPWPKATCRSITATGRSTRRTSRSSASRSRSTSSPSTERAGSRRKSRSGTSITPTSTTPSGSTISSTTPAGPISTRPCGPSRRTGSGSTPRGSPSSAWTTCRPERARSGASSGRSTIRNATGRGRAAGPRRSSRRFFRLTGTTPIDLDDNAFDLQFFLAAGYRIDQLVK